MRLLAHGPAARPFWEEALRHDADAVVTQTPAWLDAIIALGRHEDATRVYETPDGRRVVLPLARLRRWPVEGSMPPSWSAGGLVGGSPATLGADVAAVVADLAARRTLRTDIRPTPHASPAWRAAVPAWVRRTEHMSQVLDLEPGFGALWDGFGQRVRRNCRRAERRGLRVESGASERLVGVFDTLYRASVDRWARRQHEPRLLAHWRARRRDPRRKFATVARRLGPACRVWVAWQGEAPAAAIVVLAHGRYSTYWRGAMDEEVARGTGANELLHRLAIEEACGAGRRWYDMGESAPGSSLAHFKRGFGAEERRSVACRFERLPLTAGEEAARRAVKRALAFREA